MRFVDGRDLWVEISSVFFIHLLDYLQRRPFKKIKLVGNERKGLRTNFPKWREPQTKLYLIYHFTRTILLLKSLTTSDIDRR
jgi:hypothetical protein